MKRVIGVLGLQGDFAQHQKSLKRLNVESRIVRWPDDLSKCEGLILPGGESTTFSKLLSETDLFQSIQYFASDKPVMGTCAGLIMLASSVTNDPLQTLGLIQCTVERNGYGRQVDSFIDTIRIPCFGKKPQFEGVFIRAPKIQEIGQGTEALGFHGENVVILRNKRILAMTFHPELTNDCRIHQFFIKEFVEKR
jgi:5'-phosphate synthase pdxT subunit